MAVTPESVKRLSARKIQVRVEAGAGLPAYFSDEEYRASGADVEATRSSLIDTTDALLFVRAPSLEEVQGMASGALLIAPLAPLQRLDLVRAIAARGLSSLSLDLIVRTSAAQMMDVLSSQATIAGYCAVLLAANEVPRFFPMLMTAAGTISPARVVVLGAGVAGLQAIGTARRLGAVVEAFDVRKAVKEQVESLGAKFITVVTSEDAAGADGYAREVSASDKQVQAEAISRHVKTADVVVTTALIPGQRAPVLVTEAMIKTMKPGSVIVDLAAEQGGNCELTEPGSVVVRHGVTLIGLLDLPSRLAVHASQMFARNMEKLLAHITKDGSLLLNQDDEIIAGCLVTLNGNVVHTKVKERLGVSAAPTTLGVSG